MSRNDAGSETTERKTRSTEGHGRKQDQVQSRATEKYYEQIFEEMKELEDKKSEESLLRKLCSCTEKAHFDEKSE